MTSNKKILVYVLIVCLIIFTLAFFNSPKEKVHYYDYDFSISESEGSGVNVDVDKLHFGVFNYNQSGFRTRWFTFHNNFDTPHMVNIQIKGNLSNRLWLEENNFILQPNEVRKLKVMINIQKQSLEPGLYEGRLKVEYIDQ